MKYGQGGIKDISKFNNVTFRDIEVDGVSDWADDGVTFDNCQFINIGKNGIGSFDAEVIVRESNKFESQPIGVDIITTFPIIFSSKIGKLGMPGNNFKCQKAGVNIQSSSNVESLTILNNKFDGGNKGIRQNGNGLLHIEKNQLKGHLTGVELHGAGINFNHVMNNEIQGSFLGAHTVKQNTGLRYSDNCFSGNSLVDIFVSDGNIFPWQGNMAKAAGNCFTKGGIPEIDNDAGTDAIFYFLKTGTPMNSCKFPVNLKNVTLLQTSMADNPSDCGPDGFVGGEGYINCEFSEEHSIENLIQIRTQLLAEGETLTDAFSIKQNERCLETIKSLIGRKMFEPNSVDPLAGKESAIAFFNGEGMEFRDKTNAYGIMVSHNELQRARTFLNQMETQFEWEANFVTVQNINLDYLSDIIRYELNEVQRNTLYQIATNEDDPYNGYARSLYEVLTGERIEVTIPEWVGERDIKDAAKPTSNGYIQVYPNPASKGLVQIHIHPSVQHDVASLIITDAFGKKQFEYPTSGSEIVQIDVSRFNAGVYYISLLNPENLKISVAKFIVFN